MKQFEIYSQKGIMLIVFALMLPLLMFLGSIVLDLGRVLAYKSKLQNVVDAAALAGMMQVEHMDRVYLTSDFPEGAVEERLQNDIESATDKSIQGNGLNVPSDKKLFKKDSIYYYLVEVQDYVPLTFARAFMPDSFMPDGVKVHAYAWAKTNEKYSETEIYSQLYNIGWNQTAKLMTEIRDHGGGNDRAEKMDSKDGINYSYSKDADGNVSMSRTETVNTREVKTWKYMFVDFQPDIQMDIKKGVLINGEWNFPFENWDGLSALSESDFARFKYDNILNLDTGSGRGSMTRATLINKLMSTYGMSKDEAIQMLSTPIENIVSFKNLHKVRGNTVEELTAWEEKNIKRTDRTVAGEKEVADYLDNQSLAQLVVRNVKGEIVASDPLLVRIESEDMTRLHSYGNNNLFYASSVRTLTLKIDSDNTASTYRPLIIYYFGPQDSDENVNAGRVSQPVTLELNANFKGILFAPYSPIVVKHNGYKIQGIIIGKSFRMEKNGQDLNPNSSLLYRQLGFKDNQLEFDDFDLTDIPIEAQIRKNAILTSEQAKYIKF